MNVMQWLGLIYQVVQCQGPCVQNDGKTFLVFTYIWQEDIAKIFKVPGSRHDVNPARAIAWLVGVTNHCTMFQQQFTYILPVFTRQYTFEKKARRNAH